MKWASFDADGFPQGFFAEDVHGPLMAPVYGLTPEPTEDDPAPVPPKIGETRNPAIPADVVEITDEQWQEFLAYRGRRRWDGSEVVVYEPPPLPPFVPAVVEDWQFAGQAAEEGIISRNEALDWSGAGIVPPTLIEAVDRLITDEDQHFKVMIFLRGSKAYPRSHTLVPLLGRVFGKTDDAALDAFWIAAGQR